MPPRKTTKKTNDDVKVEEVAPKRTLRTRKPKEIIDEPEKLPEPKVKKTAKTSESKPTKKTETKQNGKEKKTKVAKPKEIVDEPEEVAETKVKKSVTKKTETKQNGKEKREEVSDTKAKQNGKEKKVGTKSRSKTTGEDENETVEIKKPTKRKIKDDAVEDSKPPAKSKKIEDNEVPEKIPAKNRRKAKDVGDQSADSPKKSRAASEEPPKVAPKALKNKTVNDFEAIDYSCSRPNEDDQTWNFKIASWNVDGIRAWHNKSCLGYVESEKPDIFCIQETKCTYEKLPDEIKTYKGYHQYWCSAAKEGYSGVGLFTKKMPIHVINGIQDEEHDAEGRIITAEFEKFYVTCVYVPNSGRGLVTLPKRLDWNEKFNKFIDDLNTKKPVIVCGDMNVAHQEIDLKNPKTNKKTAGFTQQERDGMTEFLSHGYVDSFRQLYPKVEGAYTFWTYMANSRAKNVGWRIDYFLLSQRLMSKVCDNVIRGDVYGSDHCPIVLYMHI